MKVAVIGSRTFNDYELLSNTLSELFDVSSISYIVSGGAKGADTLAENFAKAHNIQTIVFKPLWEKYGKRAGILRNQDIVAESDIVVAFWDGSSKGTKSVIEIVKKLNKQIFIQKTESNIREEQSKKLPLSKNRILKMTKKTSKDATYHLFNRYIWLVDTLYRHPRLSLEQINDLWQQASINDSGEEFPKRTFHNHRKAIEEMFGILIECDRQDGYEYYIRNHEDIKNNKLNDWLINSFITGNLLHEHKSLHHRILLEDVPAGREFLKPFVEAMKGGFYVQFDYQRFDQDTPQSVEVAPLCLKIFKQRWYVVGQRSDKDSHRIYAFDRIKNVSILDTKFDFPEDFSAEDYFRDSFGIIVDEDYSTEIIWIKAFGRKANYLRTLPLHHSQKEIETTADYVIFEYKLCPTFDFKQELFSHIAEIEVLSPEWFRESVKENIRQLLERYV